VTSRTSAAADGRPATRRPRRSVLITVLRIGLPLGAAALAGIVVLWPYFAPDVDRIRLSANVPRIELGESRDQVVAAEYEGTDSRGRPFVVAADTVRQAGGDERVLDLTAPRARLVLSEDGWATVVADTGRLDRRMDHLELSGDVTLADHRGYEARTSRATVDIGQAVVSGQEPVVASGPFGTLTSNGFRIVDSGATVFFTGRSRLVAKSGATVEAD
jgi:lipopolysaccharide export system protein LptC